METIDTVVAKVMQRLPLPEDSFGPEGELWLTIYLEGHFRAYSEARRHFASLGWLNLCVEEDFNGFVYAKKRVKNSVICEALSDILRVCGSTGMGFLLIDADTAFEPNESSVYNLYTPPPFPDQ